MHKKYYQKIINKPNILVKENHFFPKIPPIIGNERPFWSVMIPTYNGNHYLKQTLQSVLEQDPGVDLMQIEIVDDCSPKEDPETILKEIGTDRVNLYRQPQNVGQIVNWNTCIQRAHGHWIHILHQDDIVMPEFYKRLRTLLEEEPTVGAAFCRYAYIDEDSNQKYLSRLERKTSGILTDWLNLIAVNQRIQFPSIVVKRETYEQLGGFCPDAFSAADWEMWKRIAANYSILFEPQVLAYFRLHSTSESSRLIKSGANIAHTRKAIDISQYYLPKFIAKELTKKARKHYAAYAINTAYERLMQGDLISAVTQIIESFKCNSPQGTAIAAIRIIRNQAKRWFINTLRSEV